MAGIKEGLKDIGKRIVGRGAEVDFKNEVEKYAASAGVAPEEARKVLLSRRLSYVGQEIMLRGVLDRGSREYKNLVAALDDSFEPQDIEAMRRLANDPAYFRGFPPITPDLKAIRAADGYYKGKYENRSPSQAVIRDTAELNRLMTMLVSRVNADPRIAGSPDMRMVVMSNPDIAADIGRILEAKKMLDKHERMFGNDIQFKKSVDALKISAKDSMTSMFWKAPIEYAQTVAKNLNKPDPLVFFKLMGSTAKFLGTEVYAGSKLLFNAVRTAAAYANKKRG